MAYEYKKLSEVTAIDAVDSAVNLLVEQNDEIKRVNVDKLPIPTQTQADWNEEDETSPSFIKNKPDLSQVGGSGSGGSVEIIVIDNIFGSVSSQFNGTELKDKLEAGAQVYIKSYYSGTYGVVHPKSLVVGYTYQPSYEMSGMMYPASLTLYYYDITYTVNISNLTISD